MYAIREQVRTALRPEEKGELIAVYKTWEEANAKCKKGYYVCSYEEPKMPGTQESKQPF